MRTAVFIVPIFVLFTSLGLTSAADAPPTTKEVSDREKYIEMRQAVKYDRQRIHDEAGLTVFMPGELRTLISTLQGQLEQLMLDETGGTAQRKSLGEAVAKLSEQLQHRAMVDETAQELNQVVAARETELKRMQQLMEAAAVSKAAVTEAETNLAIARANAAVARKKAISDASSEALDAWNRQLVELSVASDERQARIKYLQARLDKLSGVFDMATDMQDLEERAQSLRPKLDQ